MKKMLLVVLSVVFLGLYLIYDKAEIFRTDAVMEAKLLTQEEIDALCEGKEDAFMWPELTLNGGAVPYDLEQNMLLIPQSMSEMGYAGAIEAPDGELYFLTDEGFADKASAMSENKVFRLFWIRENMCWMYNVYFTGMPVMNINTLSTEGEITTGTMELHDPYRSNAQMIGAECNWHKRGATTLQYEKASLRLTLTDEKRSLLGMRKDEDWILHALYDDDGLIHNKMSYDVWQRIASDNSVSYDEGIAMEYVELFRDGYYQGVYGLSERIDAKELSLNEKDILYKCKDQKAPGEDDFYSELTEEMTPTFEWKYPKDFAMEDWEPLRKWTDAFCFDKMESYEEGKALLNMENAIDYNLFNLLTCGMDNIMKNIYFWADYQGDGNYEFIKIPWDLNMTWGNSWIDDINCKFNCYQEKNLDAPDGWTEDMYVLYGANPEEIGKLLAKRWRELRLDVITKDVLYRMADEQFSYLHGSGAYTRNYQKWPQGAEYWSDDYLYEYIDKRIDYLDSYIGQMGE